MEGMPRTLPLGTSRTQSTQNLSQRARTLWTMSGEKARTPVPGRWRAILCSIQCHLSHAQPGPGCWDLAMEPSLSWLVASGPGGSGASPSRSHLPGVSSSSLGCSSIGIRQAAWFQERGTELGVAVSAPSLLCLLVPAAPIKSVDHAHCLHLLLNLLCLPFVSTLRPATPPRPPSLPS